MQRVRFLFSITLILLMAACQTPSGRIQDRYPPIRFQHEAPWTLNVGTIVFHKDNPPISIDEKALSYLPHNMIELIEQWVEDRFIAGGKSRSMIVYIKDLHIKVDDVPSHMALNATERFTIYLKLGIQDCLYDPNKPENQFHVTVERSDLIAKNADVYAKEEMLHHMIRDVMMGLNLETNHAIPRYFPNLILAEGDCEEFLKRDLPRN